MHEPRLRRRIIRRCFLSADASTTPAHAFLADELLTWVRKSFDVLPGTIASTSAGTPAAQRYKLLCRA